MGPRCPRCGKALEAEPLSRKSHAHVCPDGHGGYIEGKELADAVPIAPLEALREARERAALPGGPCPGCATTMLILGVRRHAEWLEIDACPSCGGHWFDGDEFTRLHRPPPRSASAGTPEGAKGLAGGGDSAVGSFVGAVSVLDLGDLFDAFG